ncbi:MAG: alpha/beta fold hydrolase [Pseudomonadota bacterium]
MKTMKINGTVINYEHRINPNWTGPTIVLVHGFGASLESWEEIFHALCETYSVVRLDLRGHGLSAKPLDSNYSLVDQAVILTALIEKLGLNAVHLVGHSYGGGVVLTAYISSLRAAGISPIKSLILINSAGYRQEFPFFVTAVEKPLIQFFVNLFPAKLRASVLLHKIMMVKAQITGERIERYAKYFDLPGASHAIGEAARALLPADLDSWVASYRDISVPCLIIWGENDPAIPVEFAHRFKQDIPRSTLSILPDTGHIPHEERPQETLSIIKLFVGEIE